MTSACFILASLYVGFTYNIMIFNKIKKYANVYVLHGTKTNGNLDCIATMKLIHTRTSVEFLHACKMVELYTILNTLT